MITSKLREEGVHKEEGTEREGYLEIQKGSLKKGFREGWQRVRGGVEERRFID